MTFEKYWSLLLEKNPNLNNDVISIKITGLKSMLQQSYDKGFDSCTNNKQNLHEQKSIYDNDVNGFKSMLGIK